MNTMFRSRRDSRLRANLASVMDLPPSAMDDPNPFVPPSQYEVRHCVLHAALLPLPRLEAL